jgi:hypothetical protein
VLRALVTDALKERRMKNSRMGALVESLRQVDQMKTKAGQRLRQLHKLPHPTDEERNEAWQLLRSVRTLTTQNRRLRRAVADVRLRQ